MGNSIVADRARSLPSDHVSGSVNAMNSPPMSVDFVPHFVEREVSRALSCQPGLAVSNLVVRRINGGVCISGVVDACDDNIDVCGLARQVKGVNQVLNRLLVRSTTFS